MPFQPGKYKLTNVKTSGAALDLSGGDNQSIIAFSPHGGPNQQWEFQQVDGDIFHIRNVGSGKWITFSGPEENGTQVIGHDDPRPWRVKVGHEGENVKDPRESIRILLPRKDIDINIDLKDHGDGTAGNTVQLWEKTAGKGQAWYFDRVN